MLNTITQLIREVLVLSVLVFIADVVSAIFFRRAFFGKIITGLIKHSWVTLKWFFRISKRTGKMTYKLSKKTYKFLKKQNKKYNKKKQANKTNQKVANGEFDNVIDLKAFLESKRNKNV